MDQSKQQEFRRILANFDTGMLVTHGEMGQFAAQPVVLSTAEGDERLWLALGVDADRATEPAATDRCLLVCERPGRHLTIAGSCMLERDPQLVAQVWKQSWQAWFPKGPQTSSLLLARFTPQQAEYWDHTGLMRLTYVFEAARSIVRGAARPPRHEIHVRL